MKCYCLLKDLPGIQAGTRFNKNEEENIYFDRLHPDKWIVKISSEIVENNPDWFEELKDHDSNLVALCGVNFYPVLMVDYRKDLVVILEGNRETKLPLKSVEIKIKH